MLLAPFLRRWNYTRHHEQVRVPCHAGFYIPGPMPAATGAWMSKLCSLNEVTWCPQPVTTWLACCSTSARLLRHRQCMHAS